MELSPQGPSVSDPGRDADVVIRCRVRLARNIAGFPFVNKSSDVQRTELLNLAKNVLMNGVADKMIWVDLRSATAQDRKLLVERHLISTQHADASLPRAVAISGDEKLSIMINEEDHLRMQCIEPGLHLFEAYERINSLDNTIEGKLDYAYSERWGYLTACPTNIGTGVRLSAMLHLPALKLTNEIERVRRAAKDLHLAVRGYYGEGSESAGDFYQISNQVTLGRSENDLMEEFGTRVLPKIIEYEQQARKILAERNGVVLDDRVYRAFGILHGARLLGTDEAMKLLSRVRLGIYLGRLKGLNIAAIDRLFLQIQPAHLRQQAGMHMQPDELRAARATLIRKTLEA